MVTFSVPDVACEIKGVPPAADLTAAVAPAPKERLLQRAFASFSEAAALLEHSYRQLQCEVLALRQELARANAELEQTQEMLRRKQALAEIAAMLAHEVRNPLASMELLAGLLAGCPLDRGGRVWLEQLRAGVRLLAATVNNVLQFHIPEQPELLPVPVADVLEAAQRFLHPMAEQAGVRLRMQHQLEGVRVAADRHGLQQVMLNLGLNAFRAARPGGTLRIAGRRVESWAAIEVSDDGCGIPEENLERIFECGFTTRQGSPGIGLAVCKDIMEHHRGTISVSSTAGAGTSFTLRLPIAEAAQ